MNKSNNTFIRSVIADVVAGPAGAATYAEARWGVDAGATQVVKALTNPMLAGADAKGGASQPPPIGTAFTLTESILKGETRTEHLSPLLVRRMSFKRRSLRLRIGQRTRYRSWGRDQARIDVRVHADVPSLGVDGCDSKVTIPAANMGHSMPA